MIFQVRPILMDPWALSAPVSTSSLRYTQATSTREMKAPPTMPMLLEKASTTSRMVTPETPPISTMEITAVATPTVLTVVTRDQPVLSFTAEITTSMMEIIEVKPATARPAKNSTPTSSEAGAADTIVGKATNAKPSPEAATSSTAVPAEGRSEERRVGKEWRRTWATRGRTER